MTLYFASLNGAGPRLAGLVVAGILALAGVSTAAARHDSETETSLQACAQALLSAASPEPPTNSGNGSNFKLPQKCESLVSRNNWLGKPVPGSATCEKGDYAGCLEAAFDIDSPREILGFVRQHCSAFAGISWQPRYDGPQAGEPALKTCWQAIKLLDRPDITKAFDGRAEQRRSLLVGKCLLPLENCRADADCRDMPICAAALADVSCSGDACTRWFERGRKHREHQREIAARSLLEQLADREDRETQANKALHHQYGIAESDRAVAANLEIVSNSNDNYIAARERENSKAIAAEANNTALKAADKLLQGQREIATATSTLADRLNERLGELTRAMEKLAGGQVQKTEVPTRQIDPNQPIEDLFPQARSISYAVVTLPHPAVPRHRRSYYAATDGLDSGMHANGYDFAAYYDPWTEYRDTKADSAPDSWQLGNFASDASYGIRVYRREGWRYCESNPEEDCDKATRLRVLFIVGETQTYGIQREALDAALWRSVAEVHRERESGSPLTQFLVRTHSGNFTASELSRFLPIESLAPPTDTPCLYPLYLLNQPCPIPRSDGEALVIGPTFSGSVDGLSEAASTLGKQLEKRILIPLKLAAELKSLRGALDDEEKRRRRYSVTTDSDSNASVDSLTAKLTGLRRCLDALEFRSGDRTGSTPSTSACQAAKSSGENKQSNDCPADSCIAQVKHDNCRTSSGEQSDQDALGRVCRLHERATELAGKLERAAILTSTVQVAVHAISATATATSNDKINSDNPQRFTQQTLAISDEDKLRAILEHVQKIGAPIQDDTMLGKFRPYIALLQKPVERVAMLHEPTAFGRDAYLTLRRIAKASAKKNSGPHKPSFTIDENDIVGLDFPPNISDLRQKLRDSDKQTRAKLDLSDLTAGNSHLPIEEGVENGNEYPNGTGSKLAAVGAEQRLRLQLDELARSKPDVIIVVASDVRDRLYLFDRLSRTNTDAVLVDLEADLLLAHPDYQHATRGIRMLSSSALDDRALHNNSTSHCTTRPTEGYLRQFDSSRSALLHELIRCDGVLSRAAQPFIYRIGRRGPELVPESGGRDTTWAVHSGLASGAADLTCLLALGYCLVQMVVSIGESLAGRLPGAALILVNAPWWNSPLLRLRDAAGMSVLVAASLLLTAFIIPFFEHRSAQRGFLALAVLVLLAALAQILWYVIARRLRDWMRYAELLIRASGANELTDWASLPGPKPDFVATPLLAGSYWLAPQQTLSDEDVVEQLTALEFGFQDSLPLRLALRELLLPGLRAVFRLACVSFVACLAVVLITVFYPVPHRSVPLVGAFLLLLSGTWLITTHTIAFERSGLLSRLFCGTEAGLKISTQLVATIAGPLALLILSLILADQPGVMDTAGGLLKWLANLK